MSTLRELRESQFGCWFILPLFALIMIAVIVMIVVTILALAGITITTPAGDIGR